MVSAHLGTIDYRQAWNLQEHLLRQLVQAKSMEQTPRTLPAGYLLFCEHPPVFTLGKSGSEANLLVPEAELAQRGATFVRTNRGGDITFHGPGQLVCYPVFDLSFFFTDLHRYMRTLEEAVIGLLADFGIAAGRYPAYTGVWLDAQNDARARKICAMGVRTSRWVTMHGLALNVNTDLEWFNAIVPCGITGKAVAGMAQELHSPQPMPTVVQTLQAHLAEQFGFTVLPGDAHQNGLALLRDATLHAPQPLGNGPATSLLPE